MVTKVLRRSGILLLSLILGIAAVWGIAFSGVFAAEEPTEINVTAVDKPILGDGGYINIKVYFDQKFLLSDDIGSAENIEGYNLLDKIELNGKTLREIEASCAAGPDWVIVDFIHKGEADKSDYMNIRLSISLPAEVNLKTSPGYGTVWDSAGNAVGNQSYGGNEIRLDKDLIFPTVNGNYALGSTTWLAFYIDAWHVETEAGDFSAAMDPTAEAAGTSMDMDRYSYFKIKFEEQLYPCIFNNIIAGNGWIDANHNPHMMPTAPMTDEEKNAYETAGIRLSFYDHLKIDIGDGKGYRSAGELITSVLDPSTLNDAIYISLAAEGANIMYVRFDKNALPQFTGNDMYVSIKLEAGIKFPGFDGETHLERFTVGRTLEEDVVITFNADTAALESAVATASGKSELDYSSASWDALETALAEANSLLTASDKGLATQGEIDAAAEELNDALEGLTLTAPVSASITGEISSLPVNTDPDLSALKLRVSYDNGASKNYSIKAEWLSSDPDEVVTPAYDKTKIGQQTVYVIYTENNASVKASFTLTFANDRTALSAAIAEAEALTENEYTAASWDALETALAAAKEANIDTAEQSAVDAAAAALEAAMDALVGRSLASIEIVGTVPAVQVGEDPDLSGVQVKKVYDNGFEETIPLTASMLSEFDKDTAGEKTVTVTVDGKTATLKLTYEEAEAAGGCGSAVMVSGGIAGGALLLAAACGVCLVSRRKNVK